MLVFTIASRFTKSLRQDGFSRFTSLVSLLSVGIGCLALVVSISILSGYEQLILETATQYTSHVEVRSWREGGLENVTETIERINNIEHVVRTDAITVREVLVRSRSGIDGAAIHALPAPRVAERLSNLVVAGSISNQGCVIGRLLAQTLGVSPGDTITLYAGDRSGGTITPILFSMTVTGLFQTGMYEVDNATIVMSDSILNAAMRLEPAARPTLLALTVDDPELNTQIVINNVSKITNGSAMIISWRERFYSISSWIELQKEPIPIILGLIAIVAAFTIISMVLVSIIQKTKSIAILTALGMPVSSIVLIFVTRALRLSSVGSVTGSLIALAFAYAQNAWHLISLDGSVYYVSILPISLDPLPYILIPIFSVTLAVLASLIPIAAITRIKPASALRFS
ncbi:MAG: ABC transporter permease [Ignavibacteria bacterium]|nr:ABC transporter permease [Ignavibacteria bacterium]